MHRPLERHLESSVQSAGHQNLDSGLRSDRAAVGFGDRGAAAAVGGPYRLDILMLVQL